MSRNTHEASRKWWLVKESSRTGDCFNGLGEKAAGENMYENECPGRGSGLLGWYVPLQGDLVAHRGPWAVQETLRMWGPLLPHTHPPAATSWSTAKSTFGPRREGGMDEEGDTRQCDLGGSRTGYNGTRTKIPVGAGECHHSTVGLRYVPFVADWNERRSLGSRQAVGGERFI